VAWSDKGITRGISFPLGAPTAGQQRGNSPHGMGDYPDFLRVNPAISGLLIVFAGI
jgi:hypothetical protein